MDKKLNILKPIITGAVLAVLIVVVFRYSGRLFRKPSEKKNPYQYDLSDLQKIDPHWLKYEESGQITTELDNLNAIAIGPDDRIYISGDNTILATNQEGRELARIALNQKATCLAVSPDNYIYLGLSDHVEVYDMEGTKINAWFLLNENSLITSITTTEMDVFVADANDKIVIHYNRSGQILNRIGKKDDTKDIPGFIVPSPYFDLAIGYEGLLWVVNPGRHTLENYTFDGDLRSSWGNASWRVDGFSGCCNPTHIAILPDGSFVTSEKGLVRVKVYDQTGNLKAVVAGPEQFKEGTVGLDLAVDSKSQIYVLDPMKKQIRIFTKK